MKESYRGELANYYGLGPYAGDGNIAGVASARGNAGQPLSSENIPLVCRRRPDVRKATRQLPLLARQQSTRRSERPCACVDIPSARTGRSHQFLRSKQRGQASFQGAAPAGCFAKKRPDPFSSSTLRRRDTPPPTPRMFTRRPLFLTMTPDLLHQASVRFEQYARPKEINHD